MNSMGLRIQMRPGWGRVEGSAWSSCVGGDALSEGADEVGNEAGDGVEDEGKPAGDEKGETWSETVAGAAGDGSGVEPPVPWKPLPGSDAGGRVSAAPMWTCTLPKGRPTAWGGASGVACIQLT